MKFTHFKITFFLLFTLSGCVTAKVPSPITADAPVSYTLEMPNPNTHYFDVTMVIKDIADLQKDGKVQVKMATWTPGSYLIREYAKNIDYVKAYQNGREIPIEKTDKSTWVVSPEGNAEITLKYSIYAYELSVRTSYLDDNHGYVNGASIFLYQPDRMNQKSTVKIIPHESFKKVSTALKTVGTFTYEADNVDTLFDSPIEIGNQEILTFDAAGVKHTIAMFSNQPLSYDKANVLAAYKNVVEAATSVVGEHPCKEYLFIIHHQPGIGGGLEHLFSTTCQTSPQAYNTDAAFKGFMGLIAHEYFHLWNVKRIRPIALGPFDYEKENYTHMLWVSEGFTSFYQDNLLRRAGLLSEAEYLQYLANDINSIENVPGNAVQSVAESSWDAWIKYYRPNENSRNSTVSYYSKGGVLGILLNIEIIAATNGEKSLDDVFRFLWQNYYKKAGRGFTDPEFQQACETVAGVSLDSFFANYVWSTTPIDYAYFFNKAGLDFTNTKAGENAPEFGASLRGNKVTAVSRGSGAYENGIYVEDEILEVDGKAYFSPNQFTEGKRVGDTVTVKVKRAGIERIYTIPLKVSTDKNYQLQKMANPSVEQQTVYKKLVHI